MLLSPQEPVVMLRIVMRITRLAQGWVMGRNRCRPDEMIRNPASVVKLRLENLP